MKKILLLVWSVAALCCALAFPVFAADLPKHWNSPPLQEVDAAVATPLSEVAQPADVAGSCRALGAGVVCTDTAAASPRETSAPFAMADVVTADPIDPGRS